MIESDLISLVDLKDSIQTIDIYSNPYLVRFFGFFYLIKEYKQKRFVTELILKLCLYLQIFFICLINASEDLKKNDVLIKVITTLKKYLYVGDIINSKNNFILLLSIAYFICFVMLILIIYIFILDKKAHPYLIKLLNFMNILFENYLFCSLIQVFLMCTKCENNKLIYLNINCYNSTKHLSLLILSSFCLCFCVIYSIILSIHNQEIGGIQNVHLYKRINSKFEIYLNILNIIIYISGYYVQFYGNKNEYYNIFIRSLIVIEAFILILYMRKKVYFYELKMNVLYFTGWSFVCWFSLSLLLQELFNLEQSLFFVIIGWILIFLLNYYLINLHGEETLTDSNIFEVKTIKEIEIFISNFLNIMNHINHHSQLLLAGLINSIIETLESNPEIMEKYEKFLNNKFLIEKYGGRGNIIFDVYSILYIIYEFLLEKSKLKVDVLFLFSYFLINHLKNYSFAISLCTKNKIVGYLNQYNKFCLMEDIKKCLLKSSSISDLNPNNSIRHIDIGSVILYNKLNEILKIKIYDATCSQVEYLDILKNSNTSSKASKFFLNIGANILTLKKEIINTWNTIIKLNPFSDEVRKDYMLYLRNIIQDNELAEKEDMLYNSLKINKLSEKNDTYHNLFNKDTTVILLIDGNSSQGKIIYTTLNFLSLYNFTPKDLFNCTINELIPKCIETYHKALVINAVKYSNLKNIFKKEKDILMKGKGNTLYNVKGFFKAIPNLSCGLIYIGMLSKIKDKQFLILLDQNFKIDSMTNPTLNANFGNIIYSMNYPFGLSGNIHGHHIGLIIPEIIKLIKYKDQQYTIDKTDIDFKGKLYSNTSDLLKFENLIDILMDRIKTSKIDFSNNLPSKNPSTLSKLNNEKKNYSQTNLREYNELLDELEDLYPSSHQVFYRITKHSFLNDKQYYRVYIVNDIIDSKEFNRKKNYISSTKTRLKEESSQLVNDNENIILPNTIVEPGKGIILIPSEEKIDDNNNKENNNENYNDNSNNNIIHKNKTKFNNINNNNNNKKKQNQPQEIERNENNIKTLGLSRVNNDINNEHELLNDLKKRIFNKEIPSYIIYMVTLSLVFSISTMILIIKNNNSMYSKFKFIQTYLDQNYFFNHTKIAMSSVYYAAVNIKMIKYKIMGKNGCINGIHCLDEYQFILSRGLKDVKKYADRTIKYDRDYQKILQIEKKFLFYTNSLDNITEYVLNIPDSLYFILSNGLELGNYAEDYINNTNSFSITDTYIENILNHAVIYLYSDESDGLNEMEKRINARKGRFKNNTIYLISNIILFVIVFLLLLRISIKFYSIESELLNRMIRFTSPKFDLYYRYLEELKKKLRKENGDEDLLNDEEGLNDTKESNLFDRKSSKTKKRKKESNEKEKEKESNKNKKINQKKKITKITKMQQQRNEKIKIMRRYFFLYNLFFSIKICGVCLIIMIYYPIIYILYEYRRERFFEYDDFMSSCEGIFVDAYEAFFCKLYNRKK